MNICAYRSTKPSSPSVFNPLSLLADFKMELCPEHPCSLFAGGTVLKGTRRHCHGSWKNLQVLQQGRKGAVRCDQVYWVVLEEEGVVQSYQVYWIVLECV